MTDPPPPPTSRERAQHLSSQIGARTADQAAVAIQARCASAAANMEASNGRGSDP